MTRRRRRLLIGLAVLALGGVLDVECENADILGHCRKPGEHVRGCWAVDLLLDKG